jgi:phage gpG-like protein
MAGLRWSVEGIEGVDETLQQMIDRSQDMSGAWDDVIEIYIRGETDWFESQGEGSWPPLSHSYEEWKSKHYGGEPMLVRTGRMRSTVIPPSVINAGTDYIELGTDDPIAALHQEGTGRLPRRKVISLTDDEKAQIMEIFRKHLMGEDDV